MSPKSDLSTRLGRYATLTGGGAAMCMGSVGIATNASADITTGTAGWVLGLNNGDFFMSGQFTTWFPVNGGNGGGSFATQLATGAFLRMNGFANENNNALGFSLYIRTTGVNQGPDLQAGTFYVRTGTNGTNGGVEWAAGSTFGTNNTATVTRTVGIGNVLPLEGNGFMSSGTRYALFTLPNGPAPYFGWVEITVDFTDNDNFSITIGDWAFQDWIPLAAGSTGDAPAVPGLGGLAALACGAAGVRSKRRRAVA